MSNSASHPEYQPSNSGFKMFLITLMIAVVAVMIWMSSGDFGGSKTVGLAEGNPMPEIAAEGWINGSAPTPSKLNGQILVVEAWATWCGPCRDQIPHLKKVHEEYGEQVVFIGLTSEPSQEKEKIEAFLSKYEVPWLIGYGANETLIALNAEYIPITWVIGRDGKVVWNSTTDRKSKLEDGIKKRWREKQVE